MVSNILNVSQYVSQIVSIMFPWVCPMGSIGFAMVFSTFPFGFQYVFLWAGFPMHFAKDSTNFNMFCMVSYVLHGFQRFLFFDWFLWVPPSLSISICLMDSNAIPMGFHRDPNGIQWVVCIGLQSVLCISIGLTLDFNDGFQWVIVFNVNRLLAIDFNRSYTGFQYVWISICFIGFNRSYVFQHVLRISIGCLQWVPIGLM